MIPNFLFRTIPGLSDDPKRTIVRSFWEYLAFAFILSLAVGLRLWNLQQNGFGNSYYAAAVRSMLMSWHNFIFVSFDPVGYVSVDKPPIALWIQTISAKILGFSGFSLILPQVLEGCASVLLIYHLTHRRFGAAAASVAALTMAVGPVCVAVDRYNNVDSCLVLVLLLAAWALSRAVEAGSRWFLILALGLVGLGFNVKMMAAFVVLPAFYLVYGLCAPGSGFKKLKDLIIASVVLGVTALSWPLFVDLTPADQRPYVGSTQDNSMIGLSLGWNGFQRLLSRGHGSYPRGSEINSGLQQDQPVSVSDGGSESLSTSVTEGGLEGRRGGRGRGMGTGTPGPLRLIQKQMAGQFAWFFPLSLFGFWAAFRRAKPGWPITPERQTLILWAGWFLVYALVFSFMRGAMHTYYLVLLAPPLSVLAGVGVRALWLDFREEGTSHFWLPAALFLTMAWQTYLVIQYPDWKTYLIPMMHAGMGVALLLMLWRIAQGHPWKFGPVWMPFALGVGLSALMVCPLVWALSPVWGSGRSVEANPDLLDPNGAQGMPGRFQENDMNIKRLVTFLENHHQGEKYLLAAQNSQAVAPIIIQTGDPVISIGGFMGADPTITVNQFARLVQDGKLRYMMISGIGRENRDGEPAAGRYGDQGPMGFQRRGGFGRMGPFQMDIAKWVGTHGKLVKTSLWRATDPHPEDESVFLSEDENDWPNAGPDGWARGHGLSLLYDLRPGKNEMEIQSHY